MKKSLVLFSFVVSCAGCVVSDNVKRDLSNVQRSVSDMRSFQAEQTNDLDSIRTELRGLVGRIENLEYQLKVQSGGATTLVGIANQPQIPNIVPVDILESDEALTASMSNADAGRIFFNALQTIRAGKFNEALPMIQDAYNKNFGADGSSQMVFWHALTLEGTGDHIGALRVYGQLMSLPGNNPRKPIALYRQAAVFLKMGDSRTAELTLKKLINDYPTSSEASMAKERLADLR